MATEMRRLLKKLLSKFVKMAVIKEAETPIKVDYKCRDNFP